MIERIAQQLGRHLPPVLMAAFVLGTAGWFYHVNSSKLALALGGAGILLLLCLLPGTGCRPAGSRLPWAILGLLSLPTLVGLPGALIHEPLYNFQYELATDLVCLAWAFALVLLWQSGTGLLRLFQGAGVAFLLLLAGVALEVLHFWPDKVELFRKPELTSGNPNYAAGLYLMLLPFFILQALPQRDAAGHWGWGKGQYPWLAFAVATLLLLFFSGSRAGIVIGAGLGGATLLLVLIREGWLSHSPKLKWSLAGLVSAGVLATVGTVTARWSDFRGILQPEDWEGRLLPWKVALASIAEAPIFGYGLGSSYNLYFQFLPADARLYAEKSSYNHVHNEHLELMQDTGLLGYVVIMALVVGLVVLLLRKWLREPAGTVEGRLALGISLATATFYLHGLVSVAQRMAVTNLPLYVSLAAGLMLLMESRRPAEAAPARPVPAFAGAQALLVLLAALALVPWLQRQHVFTSSVKAANAASQTPEAMRRMVDRLRESNDVYALYHATAACSKLADYETGIAICQRIREIVPDYRNIGFIEAMFHYVGNMPEKGWTILDRAYRHDQYDIRTLAARAAFSAAREDFPAFREAVRDAVIHSLLTTREYDHLGLDDLEVRFEPEMTGLLQATDEPDHLLIEISETGLTDLYEHLVPADEPFNPRPEAVVTRLMSRSGFGQLPFREGLRLTRELVQETYQGYLQYRNEKVALKGLEDDLEDLKGSDPETVSRRRAIQERMASHREARESLREELETSVDLVQLDKRQETINAIVSFFQNVRNYALLARRSMQNSR
jgi:O-antigen ligase